MRLPRIRFTLGMALIAVAAAAILFGMVAYWRKPPVYRSVIYLLILDDGDARALARDVLSDAVLDSALTTPRPLGPGLAGMPAFRDAADPVAALRHRLQVEETEIRVEGARTGLPNTVALSTSAHSSSEAGEIVSAVAASCQRSWGARRLFVSGAVTYPLARTDALQWFLLVAATLALVTCIGLLIRKRWAKVIARASGGTGGQATSATRRPVGRVATRLSDR